jgi:hypothetical protein
MVSLSIEILSRCSGVAIYSVGDASCNRMSNKKVVVYELENEEVKRLSPKDVSKTYCGRKLIEDSYHLKPC